MICTAVNSVQSFENIEAKWVAEISVVQTAPMVLVLTKKDLVPYLEEAETEHITEQMVRDKAQELNFTDVAITSSKDWRDYNVHKAFDSAIQSAYYHKYNEDLWLGLKGFTNQILLHLEQKLEHDLALSF